MKIKHLKFTSILSLFLLGAFYHNTPARPGSPPLFLAHYMPWYQTPDVSGTWGYHWTMNFFDPDTETEEGKKEIASVYYPATGPYDSSDPLILEYQLLLMKLSGIEGVLVDWYGIEDFWDYGTLHAATQVLWGAVQKAGMLFSIVYEDQTIGHMIDNGHIASNQAVSHGQQVMAFMEQNWFLSDTYAKLQGRPLLLTFGPGYFTTSSDWETLFEGLNTEPLFITLDNRLYPVAEGAYPWPPMWKVGTDQQLTLSMLRDYFTSFYARAQSWDVLVASAFPAFDDIYQEAGASAGYGYIDPQDGRILEYTLNQALEHDPDVIQLVTWNDYGEGTIIEPTLEFGTEYLEIIQQARRSVDADFGGTAEDLEIPLRIYELRKRFQQDANIQAILDSVSSRLFRLETDEANSLLEGVTSYIEQHPGASKVPNYVLDRNYPNPFNASTNISYTAFREGKITISAYNSLGQKAATLLDDSVQPGRYTLQWNADHLSPGCYVIRMKAKDFSDQISCVLLK